MFLQDLLFQQVWHHFHYRARLRYQIYINYMYSYLLSEWSRDSIYTRSLFIAVEHLFAAYQARRMSYLQPYSRYIVSLTLCCSGRSLHSRHDANQIGTNCQWQWAMGDGERYQWVGRYSYTHTYTHRLLINWLLEIVALESYRGTVRKRFYLPTYVFVFISLYTHIYSRST